MNKHKPYLCFFALILALLFQTSSALAAAPETLTYAGKLAQDGEAFEGSVDVAFELYDAETGGQSVWSEDFDQLDVSEGRFIVELGATNPIADMLDGQKYWLEVSVNGQPLSPRSSVGSVPYALKAGDAKTVGGLEPSQLGDTAALEARIAALETQLSDARGHISTLQTSVGTIETDVGALQTSVSTNTAGFASLESTTASHSTSITDLQTNLSSLQTNVSSNTTDISNLQADLTTLQSKVSINITDIIALRMDALGLQNAVDALFTTVASLAAQADLDALAVRTIDLENKTASMSVQTIDGKAAVVFEAINLHVRSGSGATNGNSADPESTSSVQVNGLGNLIVGYDEARSNGSDKSGSHNLVLGNYHNYNSFGGMVAGRLNTISGVCSSILGGSGNLATGLYSSVSGGFSNEVSGECSSASGGSRNYARAEYSSVSGGHLNGANGDHSSISGGRNNIATGLYSSVSGGSQNQAIGGRSSVSGGRYNDANGSFSSVSGGRDNNASGDYSSISGGASRSVSGTNDWRAGTLFETQ